MNYFDILPNEIIHEIGSYFKLKDLTLFNSLCHRFDKSLNKLKMDEIKKIPIRLIIINEKYNNPLGILYLGWFPNGLNYKNKNILWLNEDKLAFKNLKLYENIDQLIFSHKNNLKFSYEYDERLNKFDSLYMFITNEDIRCTCFIEGIETNKKHLEIHNFKVNIGKIDETNDDFTYKNLWNKGLTVPMGPKGPYGYIGKDLCPIAYKLTKKITIQKIYNLLN